MYEDTSVLSHEVVTAYDVISAGLRMAVSERRIDVVRKLLELPGVDVNYNDDHGGLDDGAEWERNEALELQLGPNFAGLTPLMLAAQMGWTECVQTLLQHPGIDINKTDDYDTPVRDEYDERWTALYYAIQGGNIECVSLIYERIDFPTVGLRDDNILEYVPHANIANLLIDLGAVNTQITHQPAMASAIENDNGGVLQIMIKHGLVYVNDPIHRYRNFQADTPALRPLERAVDLGQFKCVRTLMAAPGIEITPDIYLLAVTQTRGVHGRKIRKMFRRHYSAMAQYVVRNRLHGRSENLERLVGSMFR